MEIIIIIIINKKMMQENEYEKGTHNNMENIYLKSESKRI